MRFNKLLLVRGILLLSILVGLGLVILPLPQRVQVEERDATILITTDRRWVVNANECLTLTWQVEGIVAIYFNDEGTTGNNSTRFCVNEPNTEVSWRIQFKDGSEQTYTLTLTLLAYEPLLWAAVFVAVNALLWIVGLSIDALLSRKLLAFRRVLQTMLLVVSSTVIIAALSYLLLDAALAWHFDTYGTLRERQIYRYSEEALNALQKEGERPFILYGLEEGKGVNALGLYGEPIALPKPEGVYRIIAMGDSTTTGLGTSINSAYPAVLQHLLREAGYSVEVINAGLAGYNSWGQLANLAFRLLHLEPNLILFYSAVMDVAPRLVAPECYAGQNVHRGLDPLSYRRIPVQVPPRTIRFVLLNTGQLQSPLQHQLVRYFPCAESFDESQANERIEQNPPFYYASHVRSIVALSKAHGVDILLSTWAYGKNFGHPAWWERAIQEHNTIVSDIARINDTYYVDAWAAMHAEDTYWFGDGIHQSNEGYMAQARLYADYLIHNVFSP